MMHLPSWLAHVSGCLILLLQSAYATEREVNAHLPRPVNEEDAEDIVVS